MNITKTPPSPPSNRIFAALAYPNYRLWFAGQMTSLFGTWMQSTAQGYLIYELTHSEAYLGYVGFASGIATWAFTMYGGVIADRVPRRSLIVVTQALSMLLAFLLGSSTPSTLPRGSRSCWRWWTAMSSPTPSP